MSQVPATSASATDSVWLCASVALHSTAPEIRAGHRTGACPRTAISRLNP